MANLHNSGIVVDIARCRRSHFSLRAVECVGCAAPISPWQDSFYCSTECRKRWTYWCKRNGLAFAVRDLCRRCRKPFTQAGDRGRLRRYCSDRCQWRARQRRARIKAQVSRKWRSSDRSELPIRTHPNWWPWAA